MNTKKCLICQRPRETIHWHVDPDTNEIWCYCVGRCQRGYSLYSYCAKAGLSVQEFLKNDFDFRESPPNEVNKMVWPRSFIPLSHPDARPGVDYIRNVRGLDPSDGIYYDTNKEGIVFPLFFSGVFCGAQIRFLKEWVDESGRPRKIDTLPGSRLGLLFFNWDQSDLLAHIRGLIVVEGAFDAIAIQQALNKAYGSVVLNPWRVVAGSGSGATNHQLETLHEMKDKGYKIICAPDVDEAGLGMLAKFKKADACTHYAFTGMNKVDWNDVWKTSQDPKDFMKWFFERVKNAK